MFSIRHRGGTFVLCVGLVLGLDAVWALSRGPEPPSARTPSVATFGYDMGRSGIAPASFGARSYRGLRARTLEYSDGASRATPLFVNGALHPALGLGDRPLLLFGVGSSMRALDLRRLAPWWTVDVPGQPGPAAPVVDLARGKLYFSTGHYDRDLYRFWLNRIDLDGTHLASLEIDLAAVLQRRVERPSAAEVMHCRAALALVDRPDAHLVLAGCGMKPAQQAPRYAGSRGAGGVLFAIHLDASGNWPGPEAISLFRSTPIAEDPRTGYDGGIWNAGAGPAVLDDGTLLVATGNGPKIPEQRNYGCSVVRVDAATLKAAPSASGFAHLGIEAPPFDECHAMNAEIGCAGVATHTDRRGTTAVIGGKDGRLRVFDPDAMPGDDPAATHGLPVGGEHCGRPAIRRGPDDRLLAYTIGSLNQGSVRRRDDWVIGSASLDGELRATGYRRGRCLGWIETGPVAGSVELRIHYSGRLRADRVALAMGSELQRRISAGTFLWANEREAVRGTDLPRLARYSTQSRVGWAPGRDTPGRDGLVKVALDHYAGSKGGLYAFPTALADDLGIDPDGEILTGRDPFRDQTIHLWVDPRQPGLCAPTRAGLEPVYQYRWHRRWPRSGWRATGVRIGPRGGLTAQWIYPRDDGTTYFNTSPIVTQGPVGESDLMIFTVAGARSALVLLNADTGRLVDEIGFPGVAHFNEPLVVDDQIFVATVDHGIQRFSPRRGWWDTYQRYSRFASLPPSFNHRWKTASPSRGL